jgi:hypothetical protein
MVLTQTCCSFSTLVIFLGMERLQEKWEKSLLGPRRSRFCVPVVRCGDESIADVNRRCGENWAPGLWLLFVTRPWSCYGVSERCSPTSWPWRQRDIHRWRNKNEQILVVFWPSMRLHPNSMPSVMNHIDRRGSKNCRYLKFQTKICKSKNEKNKSEIWSTWWSLYSIVIVEFNLKI